MNPTDRLRLDALAATGVAAHRLRTAETDIETAVARALHWEASWAQIGDALGVTRQSAHRRFRHLHWDPATQTAWSEPPLPL
jgi:3-methyladenine DNA glycosylase/8-oxoguanine DNA glycosylase